MKKIISLLLIICLMLQQNTTIFASSKANEYVMNEQESKMVRYMQAGNNKLLCSTNNYWYMQFVNEFRESALDMYLLSMADKLISTGVEPDKQLYTQTLITLMATYEMDNANDISEQKKFDNTKDLKSYFMDTKDIVSKTVAVITGNNNNAQEFEKILNTAIGTLSTQIDNVDNWLEGIIGLDTILEDYSAFDEILTLLENEGTGELKSAASDLKNALKKSVELRIETYTKIQDENYTNNFEDFIFNGYFFDAMKLTDEYDNDESVRFFTDESKKITDKISLLKDSWELGLSIGKMIGNLTIGAEDLIYRTRESMAICDISKILQLNILSKSNEFYSILGKSQSQEIIESFVYLSNFLIQCRFRGEYNIYSIIVSDAKLASVLNQKNNEETTKLYNEKINYIISLQHVLNNIITNNTTEDVSNEERYKAYAAKIEEYESKYGFAEINKMSDWFSYMSGLCFIKLVDFSHTGQEELLLGYQTNSSDGTYRIYTFEIWGFRNAEMTLLDSGELFGTDGGVKHVYLTEVEGKTYLVTGESDSFGHYYYHGYTDEKFGIVKEIVWDVDANGEYSCSIDGNLVSYDVLQNEQEKWFGNIVDYDLNNNCNMILEQNNETKERLSAYY